MKHADFKIRLLATFLDSLIWIFLIVVLCWYIASQINLQEAVAALVLSLIVLLSPPFLFYSILMTHYFGGTLGKLLTGLEVVSENYKKLSFKRIFFRQTIGYSFSWIFFGLGYLTIVKDPNKQGWHDKTVGSVVVQKKNILLEGIIFGIVVLAASVYIFFQATQIFLQGPIYQEIKTQTSSQPSPTAITQYRTTITQPPMSPDIVLKTYYNWYLSCQENQFANAKAGAVSKSPQEDCRSNKIGLLTSELANTVQHPQGIDPVLCAQNTPIELIYDKAVITNTNATAIVHTVWGASPKQNINVGLDWQNRSWKISSITCTQF